MVAPGQHEPDGERAVSQKSPDAFRTISEVSSDLDVPQHVLRFWEGKFAQIRPLKRGGGRRYYRPEDVDLLRGIQHLLYGDGYTIKGVQKLLRENGVKFVVAAGRREHANGKAAAKTAVAEKPAAVEPVAPPAASGQTPPAPQHGDAGSLGGAPFFSAPRSAVAAEPELPLDTPPAPVIAAPPSPQPPPAPEPAEASEAAPAEEPADAAVDARRIETATRLLASLKAIRRDYDLRLQAAKNGR